MSFGEKWMAIISLMQTDADCKQYIQYNTHTALYPSLYHSIDI